MAALLLANRWLSTLLAIQEELRVGQRSDWREIAPLPNWVLLLAILVLVGISFWLYQAYTQNQPGTERWSSQRARQAAEERAAGLLREHVGDGPYQQLKRDGYLEVPSRGHAGRVYRIPTQPGRVVVYEAGHPVAQLCVIACDPVPHADLLLAQKWLIEADERAYLALANWIDTSSRY